MGYRSDVTIMCESHAYEMFKNTWEKENLVPHHIYISGVDGERQYILRWEWVKWYECYSGVNAITEVMDKLDGYEYEVKDGYAYSMIEIGEDCQVDRRSNERGIMSFEDFYVVLNVNLPSDSKEIYRKERKHAF